MLFKKALGGGANWIVAGLGNPGSKYDETRHNMGFMAIDYIADKKGLSVTRNKFQALTALDKSGDGVLYMKPLTYMNLSGNAIGEAAKFYKIPADHVLVLVDDITLPAGTIRLREKGSAGGHNGLKSIIAQLGTNEFPRIKIGVGDGTPAPTGDELVDFVLGRPSKEDMAKIRERYEDIRAAAELIVEGNFTLAQSRYNGNSKK